MNKNPTKPTKSRRKVVTEPKVDKSQDNTTQEPQEQQIPQQKQMSEDPVVNFLAGIQFNVDIFDTLRKAQNDPAQYDKFFNTPDVFILLNMADVFDSADPNKEHPLGDVEHKAFHNLALWMLLKFATDPTWFCFLGWMFRFYAAHTHPTSYWPVKFSPRYIPRNFIVKGEPVSILEENKEVKNVDEVYK